MGRGGCPNVLDLGALSGFVEEAFLEVALPDEDADVAEGEDEAVSEGQLVQGCQLDVGGHLAQFYLHFLY